MIDEVYVSVSALGSGQSCGQLALNCENERRLDAFLGGFSLMLWDKKFVNHMEVLFARLTLLGVFQKRFVTWN